MFCTKCGKKLEDGVKFCTHCGAPVVAVPKVENEKKKSNKPESSKSESNKPKSNKSKLPIIVIVAVIVFLIIACALGYGVMHFVLGNGVKGFEKSSKASEIIYDDEDEFQEEQPAEDVVEEPAETEINEEEAQEELASPSYDYVNEIASKEFKNASEYFEHYSGTYINGKWETYTDDLYNLSEDFTYLIRDYDGDGQLEVLTASIFSDGRISNDVELNIYEVTEDGSLNRMGNLSAGTDINSYLQGYSDCFALPDGRIVAEEARAGGLISDGQRLSYRIYSYSEADGLQLDCDKQIEGSDLGSDMGSIEEYMDGLENEGIYIDWQELFNYRTSVRELMNVSDDDMLYSIATKYSVGSVYDWMDKHKNKNDELKVADVVVERYHQNHDIFNSSVGHDEYILPGSDSRYLEEYELEGLNAEDCRLARNELYARHGRIFDDDELRAYFNQFDWYQELISAADFTEDMLNNYEIYNRDLIVDYEKKMGYR